MGFEPSTVAKNERVFTVHPLHSHLYSLKLVSYEFPIYVVDGLQDWTEAGLIEMWPEHPYPTKKKNHRIPAYPYPNQRYRVQPLFWKKGF